MARTKFPSAGVSNKKNTAHLLPRAGIHKDADPLLAVSRLAAKTTRRACAAARAAAASMNEALAAAARDDDLGLSGPHRAEASRAAAEVYFDSLVPDLRTAMALAGARFAPEPNPPVDEPTPPPSPGYSPTSLAYSPTSPWRGD